MEFLPFLIAVYFSVCVDFELYLWGSCSGVNLGDIVCVEGDKDADFVVVTGNDILFSPREEGVLFGSSGCLLCNTIKQKKYLFYDDMCYMWF